MGCCSEGAVSCDKCKSWLLTRTDLLSHDSYKQAGNIRMSCVAMEFCLPWISVQQLHEKFDKQKQVRLSPKLYSCCHKLLFFVFVLFFDFLRREGGGEMWGVIFCDQMVQLWCKPASPGRSQRVFYSLPPPPPSIYQSSVVVDVRTNKSYFVSTGCPCPASSHPPAFSWPVAPGQRWRRRRVS